jgi:CheY-like chemotaxis protein
MNNNGVVHILLIEDDPEDIEIFTDVLQTITDKVVLTTIEDGQTALKILKEGDLFPDIIFLDLNVPYMNGLEVLTKIKTLPLLRNIPIVVHTAVDDRSVVEKCKELGVAKVVAKSPDTKTLEKELRACTLVKTTN